MDNLSGTLVIRTTPVSQRSISAACAVVLFAFGLTVGGLSSSPLGATPPWDQLGSDIDGLGENDRSGHSISMSSDGTRLAIGAPRGGAGGQDSGYVRVYEWSESSWVQLGSDIEGEAARSESGYSVALSGDGTRLAIGARLNSGGGTFAGHVRVYAWDGSAWLQVGDDVDGHAQYEQTGYSVALSDNGSVMAVGGVGASSNRGVARIYDWTGSAWAQIGNDIDGEASGDISGWSISLAASGNRIAIGAPGNDGTGQTAGHVRVYDRSGSTWVQVGSDIDGEAADDYSGRSVALSADGTHLAVGAPKNDGADPDAGQVRVFQWTGAEWTGVGDDLDGDQSNGQAGSSVALSEDGSRVAIGSPGTGAGRVQVFQWTGAAWIQVGVDTSGEDSDDFFGYSLALSGDGTAFASGAPNNTDAGSKAGHARVHGAVSAAPVPSAPTGVSASAGDGLADVSWVAPASSGGSAITGYTVTASPGGATCTTSGTLTCTVFGLTNGTPYSFTVTATNADGTSPPSVGSTWATPAGPPDAPTDVFGVPGDEEVSVFWLAPPSDGGSTITGYTVTASPGGTTCATTGALTCTIGGLTNGTPYSFTVTATNAIGTSAASTTSAPVSPAPLPGVPLDVTAVAGDARADVTWSPPAEGGVIIAYTITASPGGNRCATAGALVCTVTGLTNGTTYTFTATATSSIGTGASSAPSNSVTPIDGPEAPEDDVTLDNEGGSDGVEDSTGGGGTSTGGTGSTGTGGEGSGTDGGSGSIQGSVFEIPPCPSPDMPFTDIGNVISQTDVACIYGLGITSGTTPTTYDPAGLVDRNQMASFLARLWRALAAR